MKKDLLFGSLLVISGMLLGILKYTGMTAHIIISVVGALLLIAYTVLTIKKWKIKPLEIVLRASYGVALITGIIFKAGVYNAPLSITHKVTACLFFVLLVVTLVHKILLNKKSK